MDRSLKAADKVHVYASMEACSEGKVPVSIVHLVAYSYQGLDSYQYQGHMFKGYVDADTYTEVRIFLDHPPT